MSWLRSSPRPHHLPVQYLRQGAQHPLHPMGGQGLGQGTWCSPQHVPRPAAGTPGGQTSAGKIFLKQPLTAKFPKREDQHTETTSMQRRGKRRRCRNLIICRNLLILVCHVNSLQLLMEHLLMSLELRQVLWLLVGHTRPKFTCRQPA